MRLAINTGGGDAPGLNAVIRAAVLAGLQRGWEVYGIRRGYDGLFRDDGLVPLTAQSVEEITRIGGTILGTTNRGNPLEWPEEQPDGSVKTVDLSGRIVEAFRDRGLDALVAIGGDGSLRIASSLHERGLPVVGVPKTIDNDLAATQFTFGFHTAVQTATEAIDKIHTTAKAHERTMVVEVMGRHTGWIALFAGLSGDADVVLIPEIPYEEEKVFERVELPYHTGQDHAIVVVAEGALPRGGEPSFVDKGGVGAAARYGGIAEILSKQIQEATGRETRPLVLGHLQRGGTPTAYDRLLSLRFGAAAVDVVERGEFGTMVALNPPKVEAVPLSRAVEALKSVPLDSDIVQTGRNVGIGFGD